MRIVLDVDACEGHGRCYALAPDVFEPDDDGHALVLVSGEISPALERPARLAAANCPERAITIQE